MPLTRENILDSGDPSLFDVRSKAPGPQGSVPVTPEMLLARPSGDLFGWSQNAGMARQEAIDWAKRVPAEVGDTIEVRQVFDMTDFPADVQKAANNPTVKARVKKHK